MFHRPFAAYGVLIVITLAGFSLLFRERGLAAGQDALFEAVRLVEYRAALSDQGYPRLAPDLYHGYGSPIFVFYPPLFLLLASLTDLVFHNLNLSVKLVSVGLGVVSACFMYALLRRHCRAMAAGIGTLIWILYPYKFTDLYARNAYAEYTALCLLPLLFYFLVAAADPPRPRPRHSVGLFVATALLALSHTITLVIVLPVVLIAGLVLHLRAPLAATMRAGSKQAPPRRRVLPATLPPVLAGLGGAAFFLVPAFFHRGLVHMEHLTTGKFEYARNFVELRRLFFDRSLFYYQSPVPLVILLAAAYRAVREPSRFFRGPFGSWGISLSLLALFMLSPASAPVWRATPLLAFVQFPWRFLLLFALGISWAAAYAADAIPPERKVVLSASMAVLAVALVVVHVLQFGRAGTFDASPITPETILTQNLPATVRDEYLPRVAELATVGRSERVAAIEEAGNRGSTPSPTRYRRCDDYPQVSAVRFELLNFPFWHAAVDGRPSSLAPEQPILRVDVPAGRHCAEVELGFTRLQRVGFTISALSTALLLGYVGWAVKQRVPA